MIPRDHEFRERSTEAERHQRERAEWAEMQLSCALDDLRRYEGREPLWPAMPPRERQSRIDSAMEAVTNTLVGFVVALLAWKVIAWIMGIPVSTGESFAIVSMFTVVSIVRSYLLRRLFNGRSPWRALRGRHANR